MVSALQNRYDFGRRLRAARRLRAMAGVSAYQNPFDFGAAAPTKAKIILMQKALQAVARASKDPALAYTIKTSDWADGIIGPGTTKAVNLAVRKRLGKPPINISTVKAHVAEIATSALAIAKKLAGASPGKPLPAPVPVPAKVPTPTTTQKEQAKRVAVQVNRAIIEDTKKLAATKAPSRLIPLSDTTYLKYFGAVPSKNLAASYAIMKKTTGADKQIGSILILSKVRKLRVKVRKPYTVSKESLAAARSRMPAPLNSYAFQIGTKTVQVPTRPAPPPVSPHVPPEAPPDAMLPDYMTPATPPDVQDALADSMPPPPRQAPPALITQEQAATPPAPAPTFTPTTLPDVPETENQLDRFFAHTTATAGVGMHPALLLAGWSGLLGAFAFMWGRAHQKAKEARKAQDNADQAAEAAAAAELARAAAAVRELESKIQGLARAGKAPPGWQRAVEKMKTHPEIRNPFALAWYQKQRGARAAGITYDNRYRVVPGPSEWTNPPRLEILSGFDDFDDHDEELAEMRASGFRKDWWPT